MSVLKRMMSLCTCCSLLLAAGQPASAGVTGVVVDIKSQNPDDPTFMCDELTGTDVDVCNLIVEFDDPANDNLLSIAFTNITTDSPSGFFQVPPTMGGADTAPLDLFIGLFPIVVCDSFVTIGLKSVAIGAIDCTTLDPDFNSPLFNTGGGTEGGWFCNNPPSGQGNPDQVTSQITVAQFVVPAGSNVSGEVTVFFNAGDMPFVTNFECFPSGAPCETNPSLCDPLDGVCVDGVCDPGSGGADGNGCVAVPQAGGTPCGDDTDSDCDNPDTCDGAGTCLENQEQDGAACAGNGVGECSGEDTCLAGECQDNDLGEGTACGDPSDTDCDNPDSCDGMGVCADNLESAGAACGDQSATECDNPDSCDGMGMCQDNLEPAGAACGDSSNTDCDNPDSCDGMGMCQDNLEPAGTACGDSSDTDCDNPDSCDGEGLCEENLEPDGTSCAGNGAGECSDADTCLAGECADNDLPGGTPCGDPTATDCDNPDSCDGMGLCQDNLEPAGAACGDSSDTDCDNPDSCDGMGMCEENLEPAGTACGDPSDTECDNPDSCDGEGGCQDNYEPAETSCNEDMDLCTIDLCDGIGICVNVDEVSCEADEACNPGTGECEPVGGDVQATLIIKQGACPAPINASSNGVVSMALIGDFDFDVAMVDLASLQLQRADGVGGSVAPLNGPPGPQIKYVDIDHPYEGEGPCACNENSSPDGITDLSMKFSTNALVDALELDGLNGQIMTLELTGELTNGSAFFAEDCVLILPPGAVEAVTSSFLSNIPNTYLQVSAPDVNLDDDGFANFGRSYYNGTRIIVTAPRSSLGRPFLRWSVDGKLEPVGAAAIGVTVSEGLTAKAIYGKSKPQPIEDSPRAGIESP